MSYCAVKFLPSDPHEAPRTKPISGSMIAFDSPINKLSIAMFGPGTSDLDGEKKPVKFSRKSRNFRRPPVASHMKITGILHSRSVA